MSGGTQEGGAPGWWLASDDNWYPPELHPDLAAPGTPDPDLAPAETVTTDAAPAGAAADASDAVPPGPGGSRRKLALTMAAIVLIGAGAGATVAVVSGRSAPATLPAPAVSPVKAVVASVATTEQARTAHVDLSMQVSGSGGSGPAGTVTATGGGNIDFTDNAAQIALDYQGASIKGGLSISEIYVDGTAYVSIPQISQLMPGKSWISVPVSGSSSIDPGSSNPADMLHILASEGNTVTALGPETLGGVPVQGYHVVVDAGFLQSRIGQLGLGATEQQAVQQILAGADLQFDVFIDGSGQLRRMTLDMSIHAGSGGSTITVRAEEDFSDFGAAVSVNPPPSSQVATLSQIAGAGGISA